MTEPQEDQDTAVPPAGCCRALVPSAWLAPASSVLWFGFVLKVEPESHCGWRL